MSDHGNCHPSRRHSNGTPYNLSPAEMKVIPLIVEGLTSRQIGRIFNYSESTIKFHLRGIMSQMGTRNRTETAVKWVREQENRVKMGRITVNRDDPGLKITLPGGQQSAYLVLSPDEIKKGFQRPLRFNYQHLRCKRYTSMSKEIAETYARDPKFYGSTFCYTCGAHFPVGESGEFIWEEDGTKVGT